MSVRLSSVKKSFHFWISGKYKFYEILDVKEINDYNYGGVGIGSGASCVSFSSFENSCGKRLYFVQSLFFYAERYGAARCGRGPGLTTFDHVLTTSGVHHGYFHAFPAHS